MAPHSIIFLTAVALGLVGKCTFPESTLRVTFAAAFLLPGLLVLYYGPPSPIGVLIGAPFTLIGAAIGVGVGKLAHGAWNQRRRPQ